MLDEPRTHELLELLAGRWTVAVLSELREKDRRYQYLDDAIDGISHKMLTDTLRRAERDGLIARQVDPARILLVCSALESESRQILELPNPLASRGAGRYTLLGRGLRYRCAFAR